jgi:hypothetical protein
MVYTDKIDVVVIPNGDPVSGAFVVMSHHNENAGGRVEYEHVYTKPESISIEVDQ